MRRLPAPTFSARLLLLAAAGAFAVTGWAGAAPDDGAAAETAAGPSKLAVLWTSGDPEVAHRVALMFAHAAPNAGWFEESELIVWGPSARLLAADQNLQAKIAAMRADNIAVRACVVCADSYGVADRLRELGLEVKPMGGPLTALLRDPDVRVLTF